MHKSYHYKDHDISDQICNRIQKLILLTFDGRKQNICRSRVSRWSQGRDHKGKSLSKTFGAASHHFVN